MKEIECPKCHTIFQVDDSTYESIVAHVRTKLFNEELAQRMSEAQTQFESREESIRLKTEKDYEQRLSAASKLQGELQTEITRLNGIVSGYEADKRSSIAELETQKAKELFEALAEKDKRISELETENANKDNEHKIRLMEQKNSGDAALQSKVQEITELQAELRSGKLAAEKRESELRELHNQQLQDKQAEIDRLKDFKMRLSTKMVGETLEQHCAFLFEQAQSMGLYPEAEFGKDNTVVDHSKGDFVFRDFINGKEYISVMFEMKNEQDTTATKHKNDDFLDKLDKDRQRKGCEYAVLVSMLEQDSELYNGGIVDKSHRYPKMLVIRPQFFMPVLRILSEAARKGFMDRYALVQELEEARSQSLDFTKFEERINKFRKTFGSSVEAAHKKFVAATDGIDKIIEGLEKQIKALRDVKANFEASEQKLLKANELADEDLTVKKLTHGAPSIRKLIEMSREE